MCRHLAYLGPPVPLAAVLGVGRGHASGPPAPAPASLYEQSWAPRRQRHGTVNADGFGIGWYPPHDPSAAARYRRAVPIWADPDLPDLADCLRSGTVLAAVRDATPGSSQDVSAVAPLRAGRWLFSLNGTVPDWPDLLADLASTPDPPPLPGSSALLEMAARCDTALLWILVRHRLGGGAGPDAALAEVVRLVRGVRPTARLNLLLTDGRAIAATRCGDSLWYRGPAGATGPREPSEPGADRGADRGTDRGTDRAAGLPGGAAEVSEGVLVASEPTDGHGEWRPAPQHSVLLASRGAVRTVPLDLPAEPSTYPEPPPVPPRPEPSPGGSPPWADPLVER